jgi:hypothetical protein
MVVSSLTVKISRTLIQLTISALALLTSSAFGAGICKWVDEQGVAHYAEKCPDNVEAREFEIRAPPSEQQVEAARNRSEALLQQLSSHRTRVATSAGFRSLPLEQLGPLPDNTTSIYLRTTGADLAYDFNDFTGQFILVLKARENLPKGAYLEAHFPYPANPSRKNVVNEELKNKGATIRMHSPMSDGMKCWNYEVEVFVYRDKTKTELLDTHRQTIQSHLDLSLATDKLETVKTIAKMGGKCPSVHQRDLKNMTVEQLEALCEREREKRLKPQREAHIKRCIDRGNKDPDWCERYYSDWGEAMRLDISTVRPALYYDLPECVAAKNARQESNGH